MDQQNEIKIYNINVPITNTELALCIYGDFHYGVRDINLNDMTTEIKKNIDTYKGSTFHLLTGDLIENNLNGSVGHGYDVEIRDPSEQKEKVTEALKDVMHHLYGPKFKSVKGTNGCLAVGCIGNHEYRTRKTSGLWINKEIHEPAKILDVGINGLLQLNVTNKKLGLSKLFKIYLSHRPINTSATTPESIMRVCRRKRMDVAADVYVYGHFHRRMIVPDATFSEEGKITKILYVINPSPVKGLEYTDWAGYSPLEQNWFLNVFLPLNPFLAPYGYV